MSKAVIVLEDGTTMEGQAIGKLGTTYGEIAFNTGMTGYQEVFTDPSYSGQVLIMSTAHIGNYGTLPSEVESDSIQVAGIVVKKFSEYASRYGEEVEHLQRVLERDNVVGISDVDTRSLVQHVRDHGAQNCIISSENFTLEELKSRFRDIPSMKGLELATKVSTVNPYEWKPEDGQVKHRVSLIDLGVKKNIIRCLVERGCHVKVFPASVTYDELMEFNPDGVMLSNGPGDPEPLAHVISLTKRLVEESFPVFGICLGHQVLGLSQGLNTIKMHNGHRGINHPVKNLETGKCEITSQNHGFVVDKDSLNGREDVVMTHQHLNDDTCAGIRIVDKPIFSVQYHPEASAGPHDSRYLFDQFVENMIRKG